MALLETGAGDTGTTEKTPDQNTPSPQGEKAAVQKRTYTRWMNVYLKRCDPPVQVQDLFLDVRDGQALMALLEELSGCKLVYRFRPSTHRIFRLNNIAKALAFLDDRHVKLLGIDASAVADGVPHVVLNLIWNIISFFQIKEATGGLKRRLSASLSSLSTTSSPSPRDLSPSPGVTGPYSSCTLPPKRRRPGREPRFRSRPLKALLLWVQRRTSSLGVEVWDFGKSWRSGLAFLALIKSIDPDLVDLKDSLSREPQQNLEEAFRIAQDSLGIPALLEPQDVACTSPDERSIVTYLSMFLEYHSEADEDMAPEAPEIQDHTPAEPPGLGETHNLQPEAGALRHTLGETSEQLLWKRWSRRSSGEPRPKPRLLRGTSSSQRTAGDAFAPHPNETGVPPPSLPLGPPDDKADRDDVFSWIEDASEDHHVFRSSHVDLCADEGNFRQSSEDGLYRLTVLDSDEEDAFSYILDLHREHQRSGDAANGRPPPEPPEGTTGGRRRTSSGRPKGEERVEEEEKPEVQCGGERPIYARVVKTEQKGGRREARRENGGDTPKEGMWVTGSEVLLEAVGGEAEEEEGRRMKRTGRPRDELDEEKGGDARYQVHTAGRLASDNVFREGSERVREEISVFRGRFGDGVTSSTTEERSSGRVSDQPDGGDKTAEISEDTSLVKHAKREIKARVYECVTVERKVKATDEKHVGILLERKAETTATKPNTDGDVRCLISESSGFKGEIQEVFNYQDVHAATKSVESENRRSNPTTNTHTPIQGDPNEMKRKKTHQCEDLEDEEEGSDPKSIDAKPHRSVARPEQQDVVGVSLEGYKEETMQSMSVCRASSRPLLSEKGAAASSCDVTGLEMEVLFGLWIFLFCYFLFPQMHL